MPVLPSIAVQRIDDRMTEQGHLDLVRSQRQSIILVVQKDGAFLLLLHRLSVGVFLELLDVLLAQFAVGALEVGRIHFLAFRHFDLDNLTDLNAQRTVHHAVVAHGTAGSQDRKN